MNTPDELEQLWQTQPVDPVIKGEEMLRIIMNKTAKFDRTIRRRNIRETVAALVVAAFFAIAAWKQHNAIERLGSLIIVAGALFIIYYIRRHGAEPPDPNPDQTLGGYQRALAEKYGHQIRLLRNVKFWYLAPMYVGLLIATAGLLKERAASGALTWVDAIGPIVYTLVFAAIWWLNEVYTVRKLQGMRTKLMAGEEEQETPC
jgi:hypothetical protein